MRFQKPLSSDEAEYCMDKATEYEQRAGTAQELHVKTAYLKLAQRWHYFAEKKAARTRAHP